MKRADTQFKIRLPHDVKEWLERRSSEEMRNQSAHVIFILRKEMEKEKAEGAQLAGTTPSASDQ